MAPTDDAISEVTYTPTSVAVAEGGARRELTGVSIDESIASLNSEFDERKSVIISRRNSQEQRLKDLMKKLFPDAKNEKGDTKKTAAKAVPEKGSDDGVLEAIMKSVNHLATSINPTDRENIIPLSSHRGLSVFDVKKLRNHLDEQDMILLRTTYREHNIKGMILKDVAAQIAQSVSVSGDCNGAAASFVGSLETEFGMSSREEERNAFAQFGQEVHVASARLPHPYSGHEELRELLNSNFRTAIDDVKSECDAKEFIDRVGPFYIQVAYFGAIYKMSASTFSYEEKTSQRICSAMKAHYDGFGTKVDGNANVDALRSWVEKTSGAEVHIQACGGDATQLLNGNKYKWGISAKKDPVIVKCELAPIYELAKLPSGDNTNPCARTLLKVAFEQYVEERANDLNNWSARWTPEAVHLEKEIREMKCLRKKLERQRRQAQRYVDGCFVHRRNRNWLEATERCLDGWEEDGSAERIPGINEIIRYARKDKNCFYAVLLGMLDKAKQEFGRHRNEFWGLFGYDSGMSNQMYCLMFEKCSDLKKKVKVKVATKDTESKNCVAELRPASLFHKEAAFMHAWQARLRQTPAQNSAEDSAQNPIQDSAADLIKDSEQIISQQSAQDPAQDQS